MAELNLVEIKFANREQGSSYPRSSAWFWEGSNKRKPRRRFSCVTEPSSGLFGQRKTTDFYQNFSKLTRGSEPLTEHNTDQIAKSIYSKLQKKETRKERKLTVYAGNKRRLHGFKYVSTPQTENKNPTGRQGPKIHTLQFHHFRPDFLQKKIDFSRWTNLPCSCSENYAPLCKYQESQE